MMRFELREVKMERVMRVGDILDAHAKLGPLPPKIAEFVKNRLKWSWATPIGAATPFQFVLGRVVFEDGREFWTVTYDGMSRRKPVKRTTVLTPDGATAYCGCRDNRGAIFTMEGRREFKLVKSVMKS